MEMVNCVDRIANMYMPDPDFEDFGDIDWCENCRHETCVCPKYVESQRGTILWMHEDIGTMMITIEDDTNPWKLVGQCYHEVDPETRTDHVYQITEYMTGPQHGCLFQVKRVGDRHSLSDRNRYRYGFGKPKIMN